MPPPFSTRRNPVAAARDEFLGLPPESRYFGTGKGGAGPLSYQGLVQRSGQRMQEAKYFGALDALDTQTAENLYRRDASASKRRLMPFTEAAERATSERQAQQAETEMRLNPFKETEEQERSTTQAEVNRRTRGTLDEVEQVAAAKRAEALRYDPEEEQLNAQTKDPRHLQAYRMFLAREDPKLPPEKRRVAAYQRAGRLAADKDAVDAIETALLDAPNAKELRGKYLRDVTDEEGNYLGSHIAPGTDIGEVNAIVRRETNKRAHQAQAREDRLANMSYMKMVGDTQDDINKQIQFLTEQGQLGTPQMAALTQRSSELQKLRDQIIAGMAGGQSAKVQPPPPAVTPPPSDKSAAPAAKGARWK